MHTRICSWPAGLGQVVQGSYWPFRLIETVEGDSSRLPRVRCGPGPELDEGRLIGQTYTNMVDMPVDEHRIPKSTGRMLARPEVEEIEEAFRRASPEQTQAILREWRVEFDVDETARAEEMSFSARVAVAFDEVIRRHDVHAFGYFWWGKKTIATQLRAQSNLAVSRLAAMGRPGVTEGDVKTGIALKILDLLGGGGMFVEFFAMDFDKEFLLMGHDGPVNTNVREGRARLRHLLVHHGKSGHGLGIDFDVKRGPVTLLSLTQFGNRFDTIRSSTRLAR